MATSDSSPSTYVSESPPKKRTPLPKFQLFILLFIQFCEPAAGVVIYPFVVQFVRDTGVTGGDEARIGFYAGLLESCFFLAEASTAFQFGRLSDKYGRRPVLLLPPLGLGFAILGFGFSKSFWSLLFFRCIQGAFNGSIGVARTVMNEISDPTNVGDIFSFIPIVWCIGTTLSPFMGGMLANPEQNWPDTFGKVAIFRNYPYLLPCVFVASLAFTAFGFVFFGFKETAPPAVGRAKDKRPRSRSPCETDPLLPAENRAAALPETASPTLRELLTRPVIVAIVNFGLLSFLDMCCEALFPLAFATSVDLGGLGLESYQIGTILAFGGFVNAIAQLSLGGRMIRRFGPRRIFIAGFCAFVLEFAIFPLLGFFANRAGRIDAAVIGVLLVQLGCTIFVYFSYTTTVTFITDASQTVNNTSAGSVNGLAQTMAAFMRSAAPSFASSLFALSIGHKIAGGNMVYIILVFVALGAVRLSLLLPRRLASDLAGQ